MWYRKSVSVERKIVKNMFSKAVPWISDLIVILSYHQLPESLYTKNNVLGDPASTASEKACAVKNYMMDRANLWTEVHLSSCRSYRSNNHYGRKLARWNAIYDSVFNCTPPSTTSTTTAATPPITTAPPTTTAPESEFQPLSDLIPTGLGTCGPTGNHDRIVNGVEADPNTWPWLVHMIFQEANHVGTNTGSQCSGTILDNQWILTMAQCCERGNANIIINFGQHRLNAADAGEFQMESQNFLIHPEYAGTQRTPFDACLVKAPRDIFVEARNNGCGPNCVNTACLPQAPAVHGDACWVAGWGVKSEELGFTWDNMENTLQSVSLNIFSNEYCVEKSVSYFPQLLGKLRLRLYDFQSN